MLEAHCFTNHCCTSIVLFAIVLSTVASDPSGKNALLLYLENANAPIDTGLSEDEINKIVLTSLAINLVILSYSGVVW